MLSAKQNLLRKLAKNWNNFGESICFNLVIMQIFQLSQFKKFKKIGQLHFSDHLFGGGKANIRAVQLVITNRYVPLFKNYMHFFCFFLGWVILPHPHATSTDHGWGFD